MQKNIELTLDHNDPFFIQLKDKIIAEDEIGWNFKTAPIASSIISSTIKTLKTCLSEEGKKIEGNIIFSFEHKEYINPSFHFLLEDNIDISLNRKVHSTTLETLARLVEDFLVEYADLQETQKFNFTLVSSDKELSSIENYISKTWDGTEKFDSSSFFKKVWDQSNALLKNHFENYDFVDFYDYFTKLNTEPNIIINNSIDSQKLGMHFILSTSILSSYMNNDWNFEKNVNMILSEVKKEFPESKRIKPKGWTQLAKDYNDYDGMEQLNTKELTTLFNGMHSGTAVSDSFEIRTSLPYVMYDDACQNIKPLEVLIGSIVGHCYVMNQHNNFVKIMSEWKQLIDQLEASKKDNLSSIQFEFKEVLNQALEHLINNELKITPDILTTLDITYQDKIITKKLK